MRFWSLSCIVLLGMTGVLSASQSLPADTPIKRFSLPHFNQEGLRDYLVQGAHGLYMGEDLFKVNDLKITSYVHSDGAAKPEIFIFSPEAIVGLNDKLAYGDSPIIIEGPGYQVTGSHWFWHGGKDLVRVKKNILVEFDADLLPDDLSENALK